MPEGGSLGIGVLGRLGPSDVEIAARGGRVRLTGVSKRYGRVEAVRDLTLDVAVGEFVTLLGTSGSGKTTTLMMVAGHELPDAGEIAIDDHDVTHLPAHRRDIGMVFQRHRQLGARRLRKRTEVGSRAG